MVGMLFDTMHEILLRANVNVEALKRVAESAVGRWSSVPLYRNMLR